MTELKRLPGFGTMALLMWIPFLIHDSFKFSSTYYRLEKPHKWDDKSPKEVFFMRLLDSFTFKRPHQHQKIISWRRNESGRF